MQPEVESEADVKAVASDDGGRKFWIAFVVSSLVVIVLWVTGPVWLCWLGFNFKEEALGRQFDSLTTLFTGLAFAGVIAALLLQQKELKVQLTELKESVKAQQASSKALQDSIVQQRLLTQKQLTLDLYKEWNGSPMLDLVAVARMEAKHKDFLPGFSRMRAEFSSLHQGIVGITDFFRRCALLDNLGEIDGDLFRSLLRADIIEWHESLYQKLSHDLMEYEDNEELELIFEHLFEPLGLDMP